MKLLGGSSPEFDKSVFNEAHPRYLQYRSNGEKQSPSPKVFFTKYSDQEIEATKSENQGGQILQQAEYT